MPTTKPRSGPPVDDPGQTDTPPGKSIVALLGEAKQMIGAVAKTSRNDQQGFVFRGIDDVLNAAAPALNELGILTLPELKKLTCDTRTVTTRAGSEATVVHTIAEVQYTFVGPAGDQLVVLTPGEAMDYGDKAVSKAMSVAYRTALIQALNLPTQQPDPDTFNYELGSDDASGNPAAMPRPAVIAQVLHTVSDVVAKARKAAAAEPDPVEALKGLWRTYWEYLDYPVGAGDTRTLKDFLADLGQAAQAQVAQAAAEDEPTPPGGGYGEAGDAQGAQIPQAEGGSQGAGTPQPDEASGTVRVRK